MCCSADTPSLLLGHSKIIIIIIIVIIIFVIILMTTMVLLVPGNISCRCCCLWREAMIAKALKLANLFDFYRIVGHSLLHDEVKQGSDLLAWYLLRRHFLCGYQKSWNDGCERCVIDTQNGIGSFLAWLLKARHVIHSIESSIRILFQILRLKHQSNENLCLSPCSYPLDSTDSTQQIMWS